MIRKFLSLLLFSCFIESNEVVFNEVNEVGNDTVEISFFLNSVSFIKSYSLENPSAYIQHICEDVEDKTFQNNKPLRFSQSLFVGTNKTSGVKISTIFILAF